MPLARQTDRWVAPRVPRLVGALVALLSACAEVIELGPEPTLNQSAAVTQCGMPEHPNPTCSACVIGACCAGQNECAREEDCRATAQCVLDCAFDYECIKACAVFYASPQWTTFAECASEKCGASCLPAPECAPLGGCCAKVPEGPFRDACKGQVNRGDAQGCRDFSTSDLFKPYCPELSSGN
jgi:hypothetical protein